MASVGHSLSSEIVTEEAQIPLLFLNKTVLSCPSLLACVCVCAPPPQTHTHLTDFRAVLAKAVVLAFGRAVVLVSGLLGSFLELL